MAEEKLSNIRTVRSFAMESREINNYKLTMDNVLQKAYKEAMVNAKFYGMTGNQHESQLSTNRNTCSGLSGNMIILTVLYYGGNLVTTDVLTVGNLASFVLYSAYVGKGTPFNPNRLSYVFCCRYWIVRGVHFLRRDDERSWCQLQTLGSN